MRKRAWKGVVRVVGGTCACSMLACGGGDAPTPVTPVVVAPTVSVSPSTVALRGLGTESALAATVTPAAATVSWRSEDPSIASVSGSGLSATIRAVAGGSTRLIATAANGSKTTDATVSVSVTPLVRALSIAPPSADPLVGDALTLTATITQGDPGASNALDWRSSLPTVATIDSTGRLSTLAVGTTTITATNRVNTAATATLVINVRGRARALSISPTLDSLLPAATRTFTPTVTADSGVVRTVRWRSATPAVATIDATGRATAVSVGTTVVTALLDADTAIRATATLVVRSPNVLGISLSMRTQTLALGDTARIVPTVTAEPGASTTLTFRSATPTIATVSSTGVVTAVGAGTVDILATSIATPTRTSVSTVTVLRPTFSITWTETHDGVSPNGATIPVMTAIERRPDGVAYGVTATGAIWQRSLAGVWSLQATPVNTPLLSIAAPSNDSVWISGANGVILRKTATGWVRENIPVSGTVSKIVMRADGFGGSAVTPPDGSGDVGLQRTAGQWTPLGLPVGKWATTYLVVRADTAYATFIPITVSNNILNRYVLGQWTQIPGPVGSLRLGEIFSLSPTELLVAADVPSGSNNQQLPAIFRYSQGSWTREWARSAQPTTLPRLQPFTRCDDGSVMTITEDGVVLSRANDGVWTESTPSRAVSAYGVAKQVICASATNYEFANGVTRGRVTGSSLTFDQWMFNFANLSVGNASFALADGGLLGARWDGASWRPFVQPTCTFAEACGTAFAAFGDGSAVARGNLGAGVWAGGNFTWTSVPYFGASAMWGATAASVLMVSNDNFPGRTVGRIAQLDNGVLRELLPASVNLSFRNAHGASATAMMAVGNCFSACTLAARYNGSSLAIDTVARNVAQGTSLNDVVVFSANSAIAVGTGGSAYRWNGTVWSPISTSTTETFTAVTGVSATEVYAFTSTGGLYGYDGATWRLLQRFSAGITTARVSGNAGFAAGSNGLVVYGRSVLGGRAAAARTQRK